MNDYSREKAFNKNINQLGQIQAYLADSYSEYSACRSYLYDISNNYNINHKSSKELKQTQLN